MIYEIKELANKPYRPANGTEGDIFKKRFCDKCIHENCDEGVYCEILTDAECFQVNDFEYPKEWVHDENGCPTCTKFEES